MVKLLRPIPSISTKRDVVPLEFVTVHAGPGATQPGGVGPGVNQRLASPLRTVVVIPGLNALALNEPCCVRFAVMSVIRTTRGEHVILGFQDNAEVEASGNPVPLLSDAPAPNSAMLAKRKGRNEARRKARMKTPTRTL